MDPVTLITTALVAGAAAGGKDAATSLAKDAYAALKALLMRRVAATPAADAAAIERHETDPETYEAPVKKVITVAGADKDDEILSAARRVLELTDPAGAQAGKYEITASGERAVAAQNLSGIVATGDNARIRSRPAASD